MTFEHKKTLTHQLDIQLQRAQKSENHTFSFKSYLAIFLWSGLEWSCQFACAHVIGFGSEEFIVYGL